MPIYEYRCEKCSTVFEELVFDDTAPTCPECGATKTHKLMSRCCHTAGGACEGSASTSSRSGCAGCAGGNCASCGH